MSRLRLVPPIPRERRWCSCCEVPITGPAYRRYCGQCWRWIRLGAALRSARRWFELEARL